MIILWIFGIVYAVVTFLAPFYIMGVNDKLKELNKTVTIIAGQSRRS